MTEKEFINNIKKVNGPRKHEFKNSYRTRDYYKYYNKQHKGLTETQFSSILRGLFGSIAELLVNGDTFYLPNRMGRLEVRKWRKRVDLIDGKIKSNLPVDWKETLKLWYTDERSREKKRLIRADRDWTFKILYNKWGASYNNMSFVGFKTCRKLKLALKEAIENNNLDAFLLWKETQ